MNPIDKINTVAGLEDTIPSGLGRSGAALQVMQYWAGTCALAAETPLGAPESIRGQTTAFDDVVEGAEGDRLAAVHGNDALPPIGMAPILSTGQILGRHASSH